MTVRALIKQLQDLPQNFRVYYRAENDLGYIEETEYEHDDVWAYLSEKKVYIQGDYL